MAPHRAYIQQNRLVLSLRRAQKPLRPKDATAQADAARSADKTMRRSLENWRNRALEWRPRPWAIRSFSRYRNSVSSGATEPAPSLSKGLDSETWEAKNVIVSQLIQLQRLEPPSFQRFMRKGGKPASSAGQSMTILLPVPLQSPPPVRERRAPCRARTAEQLLRNG